MYEEYAQEHEGRPSGLSNLLGSLRVCGSSLTLPNSIPRRVQADCWAVLTRLGSGDQGRDDDAMERR